MAHAAYGRINSNASSEKSDQSEWREVTCCQKVKDEFRPRNFLLNHNYPGSFARAQCGPSALYLIWRLVWAVYHVSAVVTSGYLQQFFATRQENRVKWFIYLTNWSYVVLTITAIVDLIVSLHFYFNRQNLLKGAEASLPWYVKAFWILANITNSLGIEISLIYWVLLHDFSRVLWGYRILPFLTHGMNVIYIVLNLLVTAMPVRLLHAWQPLGFGLVYMGFSVGYTLLGGTNDQDKPYIYSILDWRADPGMTAALAGGAALATVLVHVLVFLVHLLRRRIFENCSCGNDEVLV